MSESEERETGGEEPGSHDHPQDQPETSEESGAAADPAEGGDEGSGGEGDGNVGPPEDIEDDPAYDPEDENLKGIKGG